MRRTVCTIPSTNQRKSVVGHFDLASCFCLSFIKADNEKLRYIVYISSNRISPMLFLPVSHERRVLSTLLLFFSLPTFFYSFVTFLSRCSWGNHFSVGSS